LGVNEEADRSASATMQPISFVDRMTKNHWLRRRIVLNWLNENLGESLRTNLEAQMQ